METVKFTCHGNSAPAYSCNKPGDRSGEYILKSDALECVRMEPEFPGEMPSGMLETIKHCAEIGDAEFFAHMLRATVRITRHLISERIEELK
jgi:hypothetical protein